LFLNESDSVHTVLIGDLSEDHVLSVEPWGLDCGDVELGAVGVGTSVGHGDDSDVVFHDEVLVFEFWSVNGLSSGAVVVGEVSSLDHEVLDDSVEDRAFVFEDFVVLLETLADFEEVLGGLGNDVVVKLEFDFVGLGLGSNFDVQLDLEVLGRQFCHGK
jgi:hypothetical protein